MFNKSIRTALILPSILVIFVTGLLVSFFSFHNATQSVNAVSAELRREKLNRVIAHLHDFFTTPQAVLAENARLLADGVLDRRDPDQLKRHFLQQNIAFGSFNSVYFANPSGGVVVGGLEAGDGTPYYITTEDFTAGPFTKVAVGPDGTPGETLLTLPAYDARTRPWYTAALNADGAAWGPIYILFTGHDMAITPSRAVRAGDGTLLGVVGGDIFLSGIAEFLNDLHKDRPGHTFILDSQGLLVATSNGERPFTVSPDGQTKTRIAATQSATPTVAQGAAALAERMAAGRTLYAPVALDFDLDGERHFIDAAPFKTDSGLSLTVATVAPEAAYTAALRAGTQDTMVLIGLALIVMAGVAAFFARRITLPISALTSSIDRMADGNLTVKLDANRDDEIGTLARAFNGMTDRLEDSFATLHARERTLAEHEQFLDRIIETIPNMVFVKDANDLTFVRVNKAGEKLLGIPSRDLIGKSDRDFFPPEQAAFFMAKDREVLTNGGIVDIAHEPIDTKAHGLRILHTKKVGVYDEDGAPLYLIGISEDVTERLKTEKALEDAKRDAERANQAKSDFLAAMSHDLRTPLNAIMGFSEMMRQRVYGPLGDPHYEEYADDIHNSGTLLVSLINDVLDLSKVEAGKYDLCDERLNVESLINVSMRQVSTLAGLSNLTMTSEVPDALPDLHADERVLIQLLNNLLSNAVKFTPEGGMISVRAGLDDRGGIVISIKDTGSGMSDEDVEKALRPFEQTEAAKAKRHQGTGLGLHLCAKFMDLMGGALAIDSAPGAGTTVWLTFPPERSLPPDA